MLSYLTIEDLDQTMTVNGLYYRQKKTYHREQTKLQNKQQHLGGEAESKQ